MHHQVFTFPNTLKKFIRYFFKPFRYCFYLMILTNVFIAAFTALQPYLLKLFLDTVSLYINSKQLFQNAFFVAVLLLSLTLANVLLWRLNNYLVLKTSPKLKANIIEKASDYLHGQSYQFFQKNLSGSMSNKILDLASNTDNLIFTSRSLVINTFAFVSTILVALTVNIYFALLYLIWTICFIALAFYFGNYINNYSKDFAEARSHAFGRVVDGFTNAFNVLLFARKSYEKKYLSESLDIMVRNDEIVQYKFISYGFILSGLTVIIQAVTIFLLLYFGEKGTIKINDFILIFLLTQNIIDHVWNFAEVLLKVSEQYGVFKQALEFISTPYSVINQDNQPKLNVSEGRIEFKDVNFSYGSNTRLFENNSIVIQPKEKMGLVGSSGAGKSTFVNLIMRSFEIQTGNILIDNQSIYSVDINSLRENISFIPQDPNLFHRSILENIQYGRLDASFEEVVAAAKKAHADEFIMELPDGYHSLVGERGVKLSGGQRQRIAIARAILKDAPILILDEATSSLDSITESLIQDSLNLAMKNKTVIIIAHRLSTVKAVDKILVFDKGRIVESGSHAELLQAGKIYQTLWDHQQGFI
jgi:ATP-binding cassette subfamily B protein